MITATLADRIAELTALDAGPYEVFCPRSGATVLVTDDPQDAAEFAARWGLDWCPLGDVY